MIDRFKSHRKSVLGIIVLVLAVGFLLPSYHNVPASNVPASFEELDQVWKGYMLRGESATFVDGRAYRGLPADIVGCTKPGEQDGDALTASLRVGCIVVQDLRETALYKLTTGGGWSLEGGILSSLNVADQRFELYGKRNLRHRPGFFDNSGVHSESSYEYFLIRRAMGSSEATIIETWLIPSADITWGGIYSDVRASMQFNGNSTNLLITIKGSKVNIVTKVPVTI